MTATSAAKAATETLNIIQIISKISAEAGGLEPEKKGGVPFPFRGIDGTVNHLSSLTQKYGVVIVPKVIDHEVSSSSIGTKTLTQSKVTVEYTFYAPDMTSITATTAGLAQDYSDRSAAQAQSVALRIALLQTFLLPTQTKEPEEVGEENAKIAEAEHAKIEKKQSAAAANITEVRAQISAVIADPEKPDYTGAVVNKLGTEITGKEPSVWGSDVKALRLVLDAINKGQLPA